MVGVIVYNNDKKEAISLKNEYLSFFKQKGIEIVSLKEIEKAKFIVVIGGDGTLLRASKTIIKNKNIDVFAVNAGSLGFLTEIKKEEFKKTFENYLDGRVEVEERYLSTLVYKDEEIDILNEVVVSKQNVISKIINLDVYLDNKHLCKYKSDGLIIATPTGSTAYSLSAGGPVVMPTLDVIVMTPLAPHNLTTRPIIIDGKKEIKIVLVSKEKASIIIDGEIKRDILADEEIRLLSSDKKIRLILPEGRDYLRILRDKLKWGDNLC